MSGRARSGGYKVRPWDGRDAPPGASPTALAALEEAGILDHGGGEPERREPARPTAPCAPPLPRRVAGAESRAQAVHQTPRPRAARAQETRPKSNGRKGTTRSVARTIRLTPRVDGYLQQLAEARGIDLNAAVSVAIAEDFHRCQVPRM